MHELPCGRGASGEGWSSAHLLWLGSSLAVRLGLKLSEKFHYNFLWDITIAKLLELAAHCVWCDFHILSAIFSQIRTAVKSCLMKEQMH